MEYNVWITKFGASANNAGIIGTHQATRSSWASGKLEYIPINDGTQENYLITASSDDTAFAELTRRYNAAHPGNRKPLSGKSYLRNCRASLRAKAVAEVR